MADKDVTGNEAKPPEEPRWPSLSGALYDLENAEVLRRALRMGLAALGELDRIKGGFDLQTALGNALPPELRPLDVNATDEKTGELFSYALQIAEYVGPNADELRQLARA